MHRWRYPSLSLHGIEGAFSGSGAKTVIPRKVIGKFSIRLVPDMDPKDVEKQVCRLEFVMLVSFIRKLTLLIYTGLVAWLHQSVKLCFGTCAVVQEVHMLSNNTKISPTC